MALRRRMKMKRIALCLPKPRKWKGKKFPSKSDAKGKKQDLSKMKCFHCHENGNFTTNCPQEKNNKKVAGSIAGEALASQFELDFSLIASWCKVWRDQCGFWIVVRLFT